VGAAPAPDPRRSWILAACCTVAFARLVNPQLWMMGLDIPDTAFGAGWEGYRVFSTVTVVVMLAGMLAGGLLGDYLGRRRVMVWGALVSAIAGVLTFFAPGVSWFVVTRTVDVAAGAVALPLTLAVLRLTFQGRERHLALLIYTAVTGGALLVALLAIVIEQLAGWRATLVVPIVAGLTGAWMAWRYVPESRAQARVLHRAVTASAWALALLPLTLGFVQARLTGSWANPVSLAALGLGALGLGALALVWRRRVRSGKTERLSWRQRHLLTVMLLTGATLNFAFSGYALQLYGFFTVVPGYGAIIAGLALLPLLAPALLIGRRVNRMALQVDARRLVAGGLALMGVAAALTALLRPGVPYWLLVPPLALFGLGYLVAQTAWTTAFVSAMPDAVVGASAGVIKATAATGAALGGALLATVFLIVGQADFARRLDALGLSDAQAAAATVALNVVLIADAAIDRSIPPPPIVENGLLAVYHEAYTVGTAVTLLVVGVLSLAMAALSWLGLEARRPGRPEAASAGEDGAAAALEAPI
jgi:MFS family permease